MASDPEDPRAGEGADLPASFGLATATFVVVASMVGTGVLTTSGFTAFFVGSNAWMLALWVVGAVIAACGALSLAELAAALPRSGGDYVFLYEAYGPLAAFLSGWVSFLIGFGAPIAATAFAASEYLLRPIELDGPTGLIARRGLATVLILAFGHVHAWTRGGSVGVQGASTVLKFGLLSGLAVFGLAAGWGRWENLADAPPIEAIDRGLVLSALSSLVYVYYAYTGWNGAAYLAGEMADPRRQMPRAIFLGTGLVVLLYLALNLFYALALTPGDLGAIVERAEAAGNQEPLNALTRIAELASARLFGERVAAGLSVVIGLTLLASLSAFILTGPRVAFAMAKAGQFPVVAARLSGPSKTPAVATAMQISWSLVLLWTGSFEGIIVYAGVGLALFSMLTISSVFVLRLRRPDLPRPFRTPGYPVVPAVYLLATLALTVAACVQRSEAAIASLLSIALGVPFYFGWRWFVGSPAR
ncbi:amino acid permease [Tautonia sociabilis]|uniref:Amino acid permease n=1 Tax=Tautonia sociabilis TaxID=2080755 RepID=A0A432MJN6_9BACT|nr:amino acid permease [Tautonia sociabilis]RUL87624.1 amino acid permease [Tautonia sociabilis]